MGVVEKDAIIAKERVAAGDRLIGLASSGPHSNGYSLIRRILEAGGADLAAGFPAKPNTEPNTKSDKSPAGRSLGETLLEPTRIYVRAVAALMAEIQVHGLAHITGGGISENLPRMLPAGMAARVDAASWRQPPIFDWLRRAGNVSRQEMFRTFNCGVGMVACVAAADEAKALAVLRGAGEDAFPIGVVEAGGGEAAVELI